MNSTHAILFDNFSHLGAVTSNKVHTAICVTTRRVETEENMILERNIISVSFTKYQFFCHYSESDSNSSERSLPYSYWQGKEMNRQNSGSLDGRWLNHISVKEINFNDSIENFPTCHGHRHRNSWKISFRVIKFIGRYKIPKFWTLVIRPRKIQKFRSRSSNIKFDPCVRPGEIGFQPKFQVDWSNP